ncbi:hemolysin-III related-domain-containing protein [Exophiala viscosa]|uniref:hemolysin-III related-domain-containing protein n=1 Tax=Exophiala viscosa TaxID=2486360 RepID=UPI00219EDB2A|nr:hemolysin-III related-domain-containing protein [Exophiala viscosa]
MSCAVPTVTVESSSGSRASSTARYDERSSLLARGRRHSYNTSARRQSSVCNADAVFLRVDLFLAELKHRLDRLEKYRQESLVSFDNQLERAYQVLREVRDSCSPYHTGEVLWGAARHRANIAVETFENRYNDLVPSRETLEQKAQVSLRLMENFLSELETGAHSRKKQLIDSGWRKVDDSIAATREIIEEGFDKALRATDLLTESISHALSRAAETRLIHYNDLPVPWRNNPHILRGYRFNKTKIECVTSMFRPSNEMVNIWSHTIGLFIVLAIAFYWYPSSSTFPLSSKWDVLIAACFFIAACKCLICSVMWHTMNSIADKCLLDRFACVDYTGISFLVAASILSTEWTAFYCEPVSRSIYMTMTAILGIAGVILPWRESFNRADMAWARVAFFVTLAVTGFAPVLQLNYTRGPAWTFYFYAPVAKSLMVYLTGAIIYASQIPEKWSPGLFDYVGGSHNIWHMAVLGGILFHYTAMQEFFQGAFNRASDGCCIG